MDNSPNTFTGTVICPKCGNEWAETWPKDTMHPFEHIRCERCNKDTRERDTQDKNCNE